jgi:hypothetical protein
MTMKSMMNLLGRASLVVVLCSLPAVASASASGYQGWGPRVGFTSDPDQIVGGVHFDMGEIVPNFRWQPNFEIGFGDDATSISGNVLFAYYFPIKSSVTPYAGGQVAAVFFDWDDGHGHDGGSDTEIGVDAVGGIETKVGGARMLFELQIGFGDIHDAKFLVGWKF